MSCHDDEILPGLSSKGLVTSKRSSNTPHRTTATGVVEWTLDRAM